MFDNEELIKETKSQALNSETVGDIHVDDPRIIAKNINVLMEINQRLIMQV